MTDADTVHGAMAALGLTAEALAAWLGVSRRSVQRWAAGRRRMPHEVRAKLRALAQSPHGVSQ